MPNLPMSSEVSCQPWSAHTKLLQHQVEAVTKLLPSRVGGLFMEMGTGKSRTAIELARLRQGKIDRVIWFCPVSLKTTVEQEIRKHTYCENDDIYVFDDHTSEDTVPQDRFWYVVGLESMSLGQRAIFSALQIIHERSMVIVDESTYIKGHWAKRTRRVTQFSEKARYRLILTGTPITQGAVDLYAQMRFLSPKILGYHSFYSFARNHLVYSTRNKGQIVRTLNYAWIIERIRPYVYQITKAECLDLPEKIYVDRYCRLSHEQMEAYQSAKDDFVEDVLRYEDANSDLDNGIAVFRLFSRLQSIACGIKDGELIGNHRLSLLATVASAVRDTHVVIWAKYRKNVQQIVESLQADGLNAVGYDGRVPERQRQGLLDGWRRSGGFLVATQSLGSHGLDLTAASTVIFYARGFKYSESIQAEDRCHRIGQCRPVTYISLWADCGMEDRICEALRKKENALGRLRDEIDKVKKSGKDKLREYILAL
ncbi:helicase domain-containing protein [Acidithiobacillus ferrivorans SS3]|uniref:Helicase domain-containing protein n=1 Tax=Acidithiobacillus ferrivorans SS3 TaxID=743299 RepID=G0JM66_9PROT|nr:DEAD/DEAH box helicase [Acidithiobacillus ferrivorans]AEM48116.1 helicase domain-containing protein [Acidithiobacillus ferrivorans SS3]